MKSRFESIVHPQASYCQKSGRIVRSSLKDWTKWNEEHKGDKNARPAGPASFSRDAAEASKNTGDKVGEKTSAHLAATADEHAKNGSPKDGHADIVRGHTSAQRYHEGMSNAAEPGSKEQAAHRQAATAHRMAAMAHKGASE